MTSFFKQLMEPIVGSAVTASMPFKSRKDPAFIPFSQLKQIAQLEFELIGLLEGCKNLSQIKQNHAFIVRRCLDQSSYIIAKFIRMLSKLNVAMDQYGVAVFSQVRHPNAFLYSSLIRGYLNDGMIRESVLVYGSMRKEGISPVSFTFTALLKASASEVDVNLGLQIHGECLKLGGFTEDLFVGNVLIDMYVKRGRLNCGRKVFDEMPETDLMSWTPLIYAYAKAGDMDSARELFSGLPSKDKVAWTAMINGFVHNAKPREALEYFERMQSAGVRADGVTLVAIINACAQIGSAKYADWVRNVVEASGFSAAKDVHMGSALIDMHSKCGCVEEAYKVFRTMHEKNVYTYSSMITGLAIHGNANSAIELFEEMVKTDVKPNSVTFMGVLTACGHAGLVSKGQHYFETMKTSYGIEPNTDHYNCMVDLYGRSGRVEEALSLVKSMPIEPNASIWGALLAACRRNANVDVAKVAADHLFQLEPFEIGNYILLADVYGKAGRWEDALQVKKLMRKKGLKKIPGFSWVEAENGVVHEFYAGDMTHPRSRDIMEALGDLISRLKRNGYEPNSSYASYDVNDEEKQQNLMAHSEKLALAYALLTTEDGYDIRIVKNLRICEDCHSFMSGVSKVTGRKIIVRDNMRFHHFEDGSCSCCNFW